MRRGKASRRGAWIREDLRRVDMIPLLLLHVGEGVSDDQSFVRTTVVARLTVDATRDLSIPYRHHHV